MRREQILARLLRAVSGKTQEQFGEATAICTSVVARFELGQSVPRAEHLERMAKAVELTVSTAEEVLRFMDTLRGPRKRRGAGAKPLLDEIAAGVRSEVETAYRRLLALPSPDAARPDEDRQRAAELFGPLEGLPPEARLAVLQVIEEGRSWALCERVCDASVREASRRVERAAGWAHLARQIAERVEGSEEWRNRVRGYAAAHVANVLRVSGVARGHRADGGVTDRDGAVDRHLHGDGAAFGQIEAGELVRPAVTVSPSSASTSATFGPSAAPAAPRSPPAA